MSINDLKVRRSKILEKMKALNDLAAAEKRDLTAEEQRQWDVMDGEVDKLGADIETRAAHGEGVQQPRLDADLVAEGGSRGDSGRTMRDAETGMEIRSWSPAERMHNGRTDGIRSLARIVRARIDGRFAQDLTAEERASYMGSDVSGGIMVPEVMSAELLASSRDAAPVAGQCNVLSMPKLNVTLAGIDSMPSASVQSEGATMTEGAITFHAIKFEPHRIGTYLVLSKELAQASNAVDLMVEALRDACAVALDSMILGYQSAAGVRGLQGTAGVNTRALAGVVYSMDNLVTDFYQLRAANCPEPISMFFNADSGERWSSLKDGEGAYIVGGDKGGTPDVWSRIKRFECGSGIIATTSNLTDLFLGNFRHCYVGLQNNWEILVSNQGYDGTHNLFTQGKIAVRILGWADVGFAHSDWFTYVSGALV